MDGAGGVGGDVLFFVVEKFRDSRVLLTAEGNDGGVADGGGFVIAEIAEVLARDAVFECDDGSVTEIGFVALDIGSESEQRCVVLSGLQVSQGNRG